MLCGAAKKVAAADVVAGDGDPGWSFVSQGLRDCFRAGCQDRLGELNRVYRISRIGSGSMASVPIAAQRWLSHQGGRVGARPPGKFGDRETAARSALSYGNR